MRVVTLILGNVPLESRHQEDEDSPTPLCSVFGTLCAASLLPQL